MPRTSGSFADITGPKVRQAALRLFAENGYAAVSMRQIAKEVGVQAGALYNYTPDKQTLLFDLLNGHMQALLQARSDAGRAADPIQALEDFTRFHIRFHHTRDEAVFISYMELRNLTPENFEIIEQLRKRYEGDLQTILENGVDAGVFEIAEPKVTALALIAMLTGVNTWYRSDGRLSIDQVEDIYWSMVQKTVATAA